MAKNVSSDFRIRQEYGKELFTSYHLWVILHKRSSEQARCEHQKFKWSMVNGQWSIKKKIGNSFGILLN